MKVTCIIVSFLSLASIVGADGHIEADDRPPSVSRSLNALVSIVVPRIRFQDEPLEDCLSFLAIRYNLDGHNQIELRWQIDERFTEKRISYEADNVELQVVLERVLRGIPHKLVISEEGVLIEDAQQKANKAEEPTPSPPSD